MSEIKVGKRTAAQIMRVVREAAENGWTEAKLVRELKAMVPLDPRRQAALTNYRRKLKADGVPPARAKQMVDRYSKKLREDRARTIATTETTRIESEEIAEQVKGTSLKRRWVAKKDACPLCKSLNGMERMFGAPYGMIEQPPAHPNCRCHEIIV